MWHHQINGFSKSKFWKNWQENVHVGLENDWSGSFVLLYGWNNEDVRWCFSLFKSIQIHWEVMSNVSFWWLVANLKIAHNSPMDLNREKPHRTSSLFHPQSKTKLPDQSFSNPTWTFSCQFFSKFWIWKTVDLMMSYDFCQRISWKIAKENVRATFHIPTGCGRCINIGFQKIPN